jgi:hypothetical protein
MAAHLFFSSWAEVGAFAFMFFGIFMAVLSPSAFISYVIILLSGMIAGRIFWERRNNTRIAYTMITLGFVAGYAAGAFFRHFGNILVILILFVVGIITMYKLSERGFIPDAWF